MKKARRYLIALFSGLIMACLAGRAGLDAAQKAVNVMSRVRLIRRPAEAIALKCDRLP